MRRVSAAAAAAIATRYTAKHLCFQSYAAAAAAATPTDLLMVAWFNLVGIEDNISILFNCFSCESV